MDQLQTLFSLSLPAWEIILRGSVIYLSLILLFRFVARREIGAVGTPDLLILVLIADASQSAMAGGSSSIADGLLLVFTLVGWSLLCDWLPFRFPSLRPVFEGRKLALIRNGAIIRQNLRREFITLDELHAKLRGFGLEDASQVKHAYLEADGEITVIADAARAAPDRSAREKL